jgi:hypothetical protein
MYSTTDPWLPFGVNNEFQWWWKIIDIRSKAKSYDERYRDLDNSMDMVKKTYKDLILNF